MHQTEAELSPDERRREIATILAAGIFRPAIGPGRSHRHRFPKIVNPIRPVTDYADLARLAHVSRPQQRR